MTEGERIHAARVREARRLLDERAYRRFHFDDLLDIFLEPSWDMLLTLYASDGEERGVTTSWLTLTARTPLTTGIRWIAVLEQRGWVRSYTPEDDRRVRLIGLTARARRALDQYLDAVDLGSRVPLPVDREPG